MTTPEIIDAGSTHEVKPNKMKRVDAVNKRILICNLAGEYYAIDDMCTHEDASLYLGCIKDGKVHCSLHGGEFDIKTGAAVTEPAEIPLQTYAVRIEGERILVEV